MHTLKWCLTIYRQIKNKAKSIPTKIGAYIFTSFAIHSVRIGWLLWEKRRSADFGGKRNRCAKTPWSDGW